MVVVKLNCPEVEWFLAFSALDEGEDHGGENENGDDAEGETDGKIVIHFLRTLTIRHM